MADDEQIVIKVDNVSKSFILPHDKATTVKGMFTNLAKGKALKTKETQRALKDVSFEVKKGEFFGIVGRNGSGKSTLLKMLANIYQPTKGSVTVHGRLVPFIELGVGFNPELTGRENVYLNGAMMGFSKKQVDAMYDDIVAFAELENFMDQKLKNYSSGMHVRLAFSVATQANADILLVDEVLAVGDADFQSKCFNFFKRLKREKKTVVFVSHDMNAIREYCDRALLIDKSEVVVQGPSAKVASKYSELFLDNQAAEPGDGEQDRYGDGSATIVKPEMVAHKDGDIEISFAIECNRDIEDPIIGYFLTNEQGQQICGTNTQLLETKLEPFYAGKKYDISFSTENSLSDGKYSVTLAIMANSGTVVADWWANPIGVFIKKPQHVPYLVDIPSKIRVGEHK